MRDNFKVVAGGIVRNRDWIVGKSIDAILRQSREPDALHYLTGDNEDNTLNLLISKTMIYDNRLWITIADSGFPGYERDGDIRYNSKNMSLLRNFWALRSRLKYPDLTHLWVVDSDVIPGSQVLQKLLDLNAPIAGAWVPGCTPMEGWNVEEWTPFRTGKEKEWRFPWVATLVGGCYLLRRDFLERVEWMPWGPHPQGEDGYLATMAVDLNLKILVDPDATCLHIMTKPMPPVVD